MTIIRAMGKNGPTIHINPASPSDGGGAQDTKNNMHPIYINNIFLIFFILILLKKVFFKIYKSPFFDRLFNRINQLIVKVKVG